ncbi:MAG: leucine-rich repeat protein [Clostridia bacterium]|nr:leucine-rich repeat protein [Clostridia bacterium]
MKRHPTPAPENRADSQSELPVPLIMPVNQKHYLVALGIVLFFSVLLLLVVLTLVPDLLAANDIPAQSPQDPTTDNSPTEEPSSPLFPDLPKKEDASGNENIAPPVDDLIADTTTSSEPEIDDTENSIVPTPDTLTATTPAPDSTPEQSDPVIVVEQIVLSGSAGLLYRSYGNGTCVIEGIGNCTDACLLIPERSPDGDTVVAIAADAFFGCTQLKAVQLPATLRSIGARAFGGCSEIVQFCVADANAAFCSLDGVLYSRDMSALIAYPLGRNCPTATVHASVNYISAMVFSGDTSFSQIRFLGTISAWRLVQIGEGNDALYTLPKVFGEE